MTLSIILAIIATLVILEGLFIATKPKESKKIFIKLAKSKNLRTYGIIELIIGIVILLIAIMSRAF